MTSSTHANGEPDSPVKTEQPATLAARDAAHTADVASAGTAPVSDEMPVDDAVAAQMVEAGAVAADAETVANLVVAETEAEPEATSDIPDANAPAADDEAPDDAAPAKAPVPSIAEHGIMTAEALPDEAPAPEAAIDAACVGSFPAQNTPPADGPQPGETASAPAPDHAEAPQPLASAPTPPLFAEAPLAVFAALDSASLAAAKLTFKLMEFAQTNMQSNLELACNCATARSLPEALDLQAAYIHRQFQQLTTQIGELHAITACLTLPATTAARSKNAGER